MDEGISKMASLTDPDARTRSQSALIVRSCLQLAQESLSLMGALTGAITGAFIRAELQNRLPAMLLLNMRTIFGNSAPKPELGWNPRTFIGDMLTIFEHMSSEVRFVRAAASDSRSFKKGILRECVQFAGILDGDRVVRIGRIDTLLTKIHDESSKTVASNAQGLKEPEIPDEFLDPLTFSLMHNPVLLKTSNTIMDASTIKAHLLNDPHDPFNRKPLDQANDLESVIDLKRRIEEWKIKAGYLNDT